MGEESSGANGDGDEPTRTEVAEYIHDMAGQLAEIARTAGLHRAAEALGHAQRAIEADY
jgi:hypothetical protein